MAKIHDLFVVELAEVIKGYGNNPDTEDPFRLSEFYRFYELPNIAVSRENFEKMRPIEPQRKRGRWMPVDSYSAYGGDEAVWMAHGNPIAFYYCSVCKEQSYAGEDGESLLTHFCPNCGADMRGRQDE